ncbi:MAG: hypothetical protein NVS4B3_26190 [Gemmatimonadaceae bacterium]
MRERIAVKLHDLEDGQSGVIHPSAIPRGESVEQWAWEELNLRPNAYQAINADSGSRYFS